MPRQIEFKSDTVLRGAMQVFRERGFKGTSVKDLERATGISSGSLYNSFGGKEGVFVEALDHYNSTVVRKRVEKYLNNKPPVKGLTSLFLSLLPNTPDGLYGCLLTNSAVEFGAENSIATNGVREGFAALEHGFQRSIDQLVLENGSGARSKFARSHVHSAKKLLTLYQGILVLVRFGQPSKELSTIIENEIQQLTGTNK